MLSPADTRAPSTTLEPHHWFLRISLRPPLKAFRVSFLGVLLFSCAIAAAAQSPRRILIMSGADPNHPGFSVMTQAIVTTVRNASPTRVELLYELQEHFVTPQPAIDDERMAKYLQQKYDGQKIDLILGLVAPRYGAILQTDSQLFANVPKVFIDYEHVRGATLAQGGPHSTGVWVKKDVEGTLQIALRLQPNAEKVVVVAGSGTVDQQMLALARPELAKYENK